MINEDEPINIPDVNDYLNHLKECSELPSDLAMGLAVGYHSLFKGECFLKYNMYWHSYNEYGMQYYEPPCGKWEDADWVSIFNDLPIGTMFRFVPETLMKIWSNIPNLSLEISTDEGDWDYVYDIVKYQKLEMQKRMERRFRDLYVPVFEEINETNYAELIDFNKLAVEAIQNTHNENFRMLGDDNEVMEYLLKNQALYPTFKGIIMRAENKIVSYVIWEKLSDDTYVALFNKTFHEYRGATETCINEMCRRLTSMGCKFLNYTNDCNSPGLKHAKRMREPIYMVKKYKVVLKDKRS